MNCILNEDYERDCRVSLAVGCNIKINGKWLLDTSMGNGTHILGHNFTAEVIRETLKWGTLYSFPYLLADKCGELLKKATGFDYFVFCSSGSEAVLRAIRLARAYTKRDKIAFFEGCWHGTHDWNLAFYSEGIPQAVKDLVLLLPFTNEAFEIIKQEKPALVMVEPIQGALPVDRGDFLETLRETTKDTQTLLCFDEVISGFRSRLGGAGEFYGIVPDLACYGKTIGGGFPVGVLAGKKVMLKKGVRFGGTFSANPITINASIVLLEYLLHNNIYEDLENNADLLIGFKNKKMQIIGVGNVLRLLFTPETIKSLEERNQNELSKAEQEKLLNRLMDMGLYVGRNHLLLLSILHTKEKIDFIKECLNSL